MKNIKIALVEYFNTLPFYDALLHDKSIDEENLLNRNPGECAALFYSGQAELALIPVVPFLLNGNAKLITNYCIGTEGEVRTVCLMSKVPLNEIKHVCLDSHSRTSVQLFHLLSKGFWNISPEHSVVSVNELNLQEHDAILMIGDKVFKNENRFRYTYDLGKEWLKWTGLPFVFAVWVCKNHLSSAIEVRLNSIFERSFENLPILLKEYEQDNQSFDLENYYEKNISFNFDEKKKMALKRFEELCIQYLPEFSTKETMID